MIYSENVLLCLVIPLLITFFFLQGLARKVMESFVFGMIWCLMSAYISGFAKVISGMSAEDTAVYISPLIEEVMKFLPVLFILYVLEADDNELLVASIAIGAGFATFENICYLVSSGEVKMSFVLVRGLAVGIMHIASIVILSGTIIIVRKYGAVSLPALVGALSMSSTLHALYNLLVSKPGLSSKIGYGMPFVSSLLLLIVLRRSIVIDEKIPEENERYKIYKSN